MAKRTRIVEEVQAAQAVQAVQAIQAAQALQAAQAASAPNSGFDPTIVAKFFAALAELRDEIREVRKELHEVRKELATGNAAMATHTEKFKSMESWQTAKSAECLRHQELTTKVTEAIHRLREDMELLRGQKEGIGIFWKFLIGLATLSSILAAFLAKH